MIDRDNQSSGDAIECPYCQSRLPQVDGVSEITCPVCHRIVYVSAQLAAARAMTILQEASIADQGDEPKSRKAVGYSSADSDRVRLYMQAYSALEAALRADLPDHTRRQAVEAMADLSHNLASRQALPPMEAAYWRAVTVESKTRDELAALHEELARGHGAWWRRFPKRLHSLLRVRQLERAMTRLTPRIRQIEATMAFVQPPHTRAPLDREQAQDY